MLRRPAACPVPDTSRLLRFRFDTPGDLYRHLRVKQGFFVPAGALAGEPGQRAIVEVDFPGAGDHPLLHGLIREPGHGGTWLDLPAARATSRWVPGPDSPRRRYGRIGCDLYVEVRARDAPPWVCRVADLSQGGLRVSTAAMEVGLAGDELEATLLAPDSSLSHAQLHARVAWAGRHEAGIEILDADHRFQALLAAAQARWRDVVEIVHDAGCFCVAPLLRAG